MLVIQSQAELLDILDKRIHTLKMRGAITGHKRTMSEVRIDHALVAELQLVRDTLAEARINIVDHELAASVLSTDFKNSQPLAWLTDDPDVTAALAGGYDANYPSGDGEVRRVPGYALAGGEARGTLFTVRGEPTYH